MPAIAPNSFQDSTPAHASVLDAIVLEPGEGYVTTAGDTLNSIAQRNDLTPAQLRYLNPNHFAYYSADHSLPAGVYIRLKDTAPQIGVILRGYQVTDEGGRMAQTTANPVISLPPVPYVARAGEGLWQLAERVKSDNAPYLDGVSTDDIARKIISDNPKLAESYTPGGPYPALYNGMKITANIGTPPGWDQRVELALTTLFSDLGPEVRRQLKIAAVSIAAILALSCVFPAAIAALGPILTGIGIGISLVTLGEVTAMLFDVAQHGYSNAKIIEMAEAQRANLVTGTITVTTLGASRVLPKMPSGARPTRTTTPAEQPAAIPMRQGTDGVWRAPPAQNTPPTPSPQPSAYAPTDLVLNPRTGVWEPPAPAPSQTGVPITPRQTQPAAGQNTPTAYANPPTMDPDGSPIAAPILVNTEPQVVEGDQSGGYGGPPIIRGPNGPRGPGRGGGNGWDGDDGMLNDPNSLDLPWGSVLINNVTKDIWIPIDLSLPNGLGRARVIYGIRLAREDLEHVLPEAITFRELISVIRESILQSRMHTATTRAIATIEQDPNAFSPSSPPPMMGLGEEAVTGYNRISDQDYVVGLSFEESTISPASNGQVYVITGTTVFAPTWAEDYGVWQAGAGQTSSVPNETLDLGQYPISRSIAELTRQYPSGISGRTDAGAVAWRCYPQSTSVAAQTTLRDMSATTLRLLIELTGQQVAATAMPNYRAGDQHTVSVTVLGQRYDIIVQYDYPYTNGGSSTFHIINAIRRAP